MTVFVTGGSGEIGQRLIDRLARAGRQVAVLTRRSPPPAPTPGCSWVSGDLRDPRGLSAALEGAEVVVHCAAVTHTNDRSLYYDVNVSGTANLLEAARGRGLRQFVFLSTRAVGEAGGGYSRSKLLAEARVECSELPWVVFRPGEVYGGGGRDAVMGLVRSIERRRFVPVLGDGRSRLSPVHVDDVVDAVARSLDERVALGKVYTLAGPEELTLLELIARIEAVLGVPRRMRIRVPLALARGAIELAALCGLESPVRDQIPRLLLEKSADSSLAVRDLGFAPRSLEQGLAQALGRTG